MSSDIYAKPDLSTKVRYNRKVQEAEWEEREVDIYETADTIREDYTDITSHGGGLRTETRPPAVQTRPFRTAAFCLGVLCFLMTTGIILLSIQYISSTLEKEQLQTRYDQLRNNYSQLQRRVSDILVDYSQLQSSYASLSKNHSQLQDEVKQQNDNTEEKWCPEGWMTFGCSCYFKSNERKTWEGSRLDCQRRGADLVVITNTEEQNFVIDLNMQGDSWIGLREKWRNGWNLEWEWVNTSPLTETFWASGFPKADRIRHAAACCNQQGQWTQDGYFDYKNWICEK